MENLPQSTKSKDISEAMKLKLMEAAMRFSHDCEDFFRNYLWLYSQATSIKEGLPLTDSHRQMDVDH